MKRMETPETGFYIGDTVMVLPETSTLGGAVGGTICYKLDTSYCENPGRLLYELYQTGHILFEGTQFISARILLTEKVVKRFTDNYYD